MLLRRLIGEKVKLEVMHGRDLWPVKADISQFEQVIVNLAVNARDAMPDGGKLIVRTANVTAAEAAQLAYKGMPAADYVLVEVADTGTGIPADIIDKIFEPFFSTKEVGKGTGLGLSTVYGIVKQTGGFIYVGFRAGQGHDVPHLPAAPSCRAPKTRPSSRRPMRRRIGAREGAARRGADAKPRADLTGQGTILLVEDEEGLRALNARGLALARLHGARGRQRRRGDRGAGRARRQGRSRRLRRGDAGDGRPDAAQGDAQAQSRH